jgi:CBS domain-containing protein
MTKKAERVRDFMTKNPLSVSPETEIMRAVHLLVAKDISGLPVTDAQGRLVGILTERDCIAVALQAGYFDELGGRVEQYMTTPVETVEPDSSLMDLAELFARSPFRRCPVVEEGRLVGLICRRDILRALTSGAWFPKRS